MFLVAALAAPQYGSDDKHESSHGHATSYANVERHDGKGHEVHIKAHPEYHYGFKIDDDKHHVYTDKKEDRDGHKVTGSYSLLQPDGKIRNVHYTADKHSGFHAEVTYTGHGHDSHY